MSAFFIENQQRRMRVRQPVAQHFVHHGRILFEIVHQEMWVLFQQIVPAQRLRPEMLAEDFQL